MDYAVSRARTDEQVEDHREVIPCSSLALPYRTYMAPKSFERLYCPLDGRGFLWHPLIMPVLERRQVDNHIAVNLTGSTDPDHGVMA